jgi:4-amino-4-deoxy-L-arabinose transferase-like glycosyltransferase
MASPLSSNSEEPLEAILVPTTNVWRLVLPAAVLAIVLWSTFILKLNTLEHTALSRWDEAFHAVVAKNVFKHPLKPTLVDDPYLPYDHTEWNENHVWLHKPILPFWQIALSFALHGVSAFALRLPSAILSTGAALLTYLIGKELLSRRAGLIAAAVQAVNPFLMTLIHGYQFGDHIDVALLFWVEVAVYFLVRSLRTGAWADVLLAGVAQGLAFLCKSYLAGIVFGLALTAWLLPVFRMSQRERCRIDLRRLLGLAGATLLTAAPWVIYCATHFPDEFWYEEARVWHHLNLNVEGWGAPWDRVVFDYLIAIYGVFYTPIIVAAVALLPMALVQRHHGLWLLYAWAFGVLVPHLLATTKTPSATMLAMPAFFLMLGCFIAEAWRGFWRGDRWLLLALTAVLVMSVVMPAVIRNPGHGYPPSRAFGTIMRQSMWVINHVAGALASAGALTAVFWMLAQTPLGDRFRVAGRWLQAIAVVATGGMLIWLGYQTVERAWKVTTRPFDDPDAVETGKYVRQELPENAVLLCDTRRSGIPGNHDRRHEHLTIMFYADRTCYPLQGRNPDALARQILDAGGIPYVVSHRRLSLPAVHVSPTRGPTIYRWTPP